MEIKLHQNLMGSQVKSIIDKTLSWYDRHGRDLPWRIKGAAHGDPYRVWLSEIMLQQTTVPHAAPYFLKFTQKYPTVRDLAKTSSEEVMRDWAGLGYYSRARNLHACAKAVDVAGGVFPDTKEALKELPGIGDYTAGAIAAIAFGQKARVVDGNIERVLTRVYAIETPLPAAKPEIMDRADKIFLSDANTRPHDLPQALMDLAQAICTPKNPKCPACPINSTCAAYKRGIQNELPKRAAKAAKPKRKGFVYWVTDNKGRVLVERRPDKGLLGGMTGLPTSEWNGDPKPLKGFKTASGPSATIKHVFTHFELTMTAMKASVVKIPDGFYFENVKDAGFPSVFAKVAKMMRS
jgi:A/G-specific adenine glycosylase